VYLLYLTLPLTCSVLQPILLDRFGCTAIKRRGSAQEGVFGSHFYQILLQEFKISHNTQFNPALRCLNSSRMETFEYIINVERQMKILTNSHAIPSRGEGIKWWKYFLSRAYLIGRFREFTSFWWQKISNNFRTARYIRSSCTER
jgi:hypothetical protein